MEWVEITGRTIEEAKDAALDQLGVDTEDAEFEVLEEPTKGLFGRVKGQARVRARIRPTSPRPKMDRRDRRQKRNGRSKGQGSRGPARDGERSSGSGDTGDDVTGSGAVPAQAEARPTKSRSDRRTAQGGASQRSKQSETTDTSEKSQRSEKSDQAVEGSTMTETVDVDLAEHTRIVTEFLDGLVDAFELEGRVQVTEIDEETNEVHVEGVDLGVLVGPKGNTLAAIQELSRTVVHRKVSGTAAGRVRLDVAGYRARRRDALEKFTRDLAEEVRSSGVAKALEPMGSADRKVVHDTVNEIDGVATTSEGEEPRRRVVIVPA